MGINGFAWVRQGTWAQGERKKERKKGLDGREVHVLGRIVTARKNRKCAGMLGGGQTGSWDGMERKQGVRRAYMTQMSNEKAKKQTTVQKKAKYWAQRNAK